MRRVHRAAVLAALLLSAPLVLGACSSGNKVDASSTSTSASTTTPPVVNSGPTVDVVEFSFTPNTETVKVGDTVTWTNDGNSKHTVTPRPAADGSTPFSSTQIEPGQTFVQTFNTPGTYAYFCSIHPDRMQGTVVVEPA